ncbi:MAG: BolA family transcriptional regulator [Gammaproteobacteria bacterium]
MIASGEDCNFEVYIISIEFTGKNTLQRQQPILELFKQELGTGKLHALSIKARTPDEQGMQSGLVQLKL